MKRTELFNTVVRTLKRTELKIKKHSPEILVVAGVVGTVASAVMACKATTKIDEILDDAKKTIDVIHTGMEEGRVRGVEYTKEDGKKDLTIVYSQTGLKLLKLYGPSVILGALSITGIVASHNILRKRNIALAAAYTAMDKGFKEYRGRVIERFGKELDRELRYNIKAKEVEEKVIDENGNEKIITKTVNVVEGPEHSVYARCFDDGNTGWTKDPEANLMFLRAQQNYANEKLKAEGYLFLNDVYAMLGIPKTKAGQMVGWIYDEKHPIGDNYVDFGIYNINDEACRRFVNGYERVLWLDFNVDGNILDML